MLSRTHGQAASPTTLGKEMANFAARLRRAAHAFRRVEILGKFNGAVGSFNAHVAADPSVDWRARIAAVSSRASACCRTSTRPRSSRTTGSPSTATRSRAQTRSWSTSAAMPGATFRSGYFAQKAVAGEVGSSTMPHKVNPIAFENAEGNAGLANAMLRHFSEKLPGVALAARPHRLDRDAQPRRRLRPRARSPGARRLRVSRASNRTPRASRPTSTRTGKCSRRRSRLSLRAHGVADAYEKLKDFTRGRDVGAAGASRLRRDARLAGGRAPAPRSPHAGARTPASPRRSRAPSEAARRWRTRN